MWYYIRGFLVKGEKFMKISNYNFFIKNKNGNDEKIIAYNSFTNSIAVMDPDKYKEKYL